MRGKTGWFLAVFRSLIGLWLILSFPVAAVANSLSLAWDANSEEDLAGYKLYVGTSPHAYTQTIDVGHVTTHTVTDLETGETYYFAVTAYDIFANESDYSNEVSATIAAAPQITESTITQAPEPTPTPTIEPLPTKESEPAPTETTQSAPQTTKSEPPPPAPAPTAPSTKGDLKR